MATKASTNPQDDNTTTAPNFAPECYCKHPVKALSMEEFPCMVKKHKTDTQEMSTLTPTPTVVKILIMEEKLTAKIEALDTSMTTKMVQLNKDMAKMGTEIREEMKQMITTLTSRAIDKINACMETQYNVMHTNVNTITVEMCQASGKLMKMHKLTTPSPYTLASHSVPSQYHQPYGQPMSTQNFSQTSHTQLGRHKTENDEAWDKME
eukprot:10409098-Ditylum_brightwellii.AAC.1